MLIFVFGENNYAVREKVRIMKDAFTQKFDASGVNCAELCIEGRRDEEIGEVMSALLTPPFLATKRFVTVKGLLELSGGKRSLGPWMDALKRVPESTIAVFQDTVGVRDGQKHPLYVHFVSQNDVHTYTFGSYSPAEAKTWLLEQAKKWGAQLPSDLACEMIAMIGTDTLALSMELGKLFAFSKGREITIKDIEVLVPSSGTDKMFALIDALVEGKQELFVKLLNEQRLFGSPSAQIFAMLVRQIRLLVSTNAYFCKYPRATGVDFAKEIGIAPFLAHKLRTQQVGYKMEDLLACQSALLDLDSAVKSSRMNQNQAVDLGSALFVCAKH